MRKSLKEKIDARMKTDEELHKKFDDVEFEKHDGLAMFIAAMITFVPIILAILLVIWLLLWVIFLR